MTTYYLIKEKVSAGFGIVAVRYYVSAELPERNFEILTSGTAEECNAPIRGTYLDPEMRRGESHSQKMERLSNLF